MMIVSVIIVILVVAFLAYITINKKQTAPAQTVGQAEQNTYMETQQIKRGHRGCREIRGYYRGELYRYIGRWIYF